MESNVCVGILTNHEILFSLGEGYTFEGVPFIGNGQVHIREGRIDWEGRLYNELLFIPNNECAFFELQKVVIGKDFHWERTEKQRFNGILKLIVDRDRLVAINVLPVEDYLISVIASEMSATASLELLKAHAVISRSWLLAQMEKNKELAGMDNPYTSFTETDNERIRWYDREDHVLFDVCADDHCQRYQGITRASSNIEVVSRAVHETRGQVLLYKGQLCDTRFSKCCGGVVEEFQYCWEDTPHPYLRKLWDAPSERLVPDLKREEEAERWIEARPEAFCNTTDKKILAQVLNNYDQETTEFYRWTVRYSQAELSELVAVDRVSISELYKNYCRLNGVLPVVLRGYAWKVQSERW